MSTNSCRLNRNWVMDIYTQFSLINHEFCENSYIKLNTLRHDVDEFLPVICTYSERLGEICYCINMYIRISSKKLTFTRVCTTKYFTWGRKVMLDSFFTFLLWLWWKSVYVMWTQCSWESHQIVSLHVIICPGVSAFFFTRTSIFWG